MPTFEKDSNRLPLFHVDEELASFACSAIRAPANGKRVDIRSFSSYSSQDCSFILTPFYDQGDDESETQGERNFGLKDPEGEIVG